MSYVLPNVSVQQANPQQQVAPPVGVTRTIGVVADFPTGPFTGRITLDQAPLIYGDSTNPLYSGFKGPAMLAAIAGEASSDAAYGVDVLVGRAGCILAHGPLTDGLSGVPFTVQGIGAWAGSAGNRLSITVSAPSIQIVSLQQGGFGANAVQLLTFFGLAGSPTGSVTLSFNGTAASAAFLAATLTGAGNAAALQTYLTGITTIGASGCTVTVVPGPVVGAIAFQVTFGGGARIGLPQPLIAVSANALTGGTGTIPVVSVLATDTGTGVTVAQVYAALSAQGWTTNGDIVAAINAVQDPTSPLSAINATAASGTAGLPITQTITLSGGSDGIGVTVATDVLSPDGATMTMPYLMDELLGGQMGNCDFLCVGADGGTVQTLLNGAIGLGLAQGVYGKAVLGPLPQTPVVTLLGSYLTMSTPRLTMIGHGQLTGANGMPIPGYMVAAMTAGAKAYQSAENALPFLHLQGLANRRPVDPTTGMPLTEAVLLQLAGAGYTVFGMRHGQLVLRDLLTTAPEVDAYGNPNLFLRLAVQDAFDMLALLLQEAYQGMILEPINGAAQMNTQLEQVGNEVMLSTLGRYHNGAQVSASFNPQTLSAIVSIGYDPRAPLVSILVQLAPTPGLASSLSAA